MSISKEILKEFPICKLCERKVRATSNHEKLCKEHYE